MKIDSCEENNDVGVSGRGNPHVGVFHTTLCVRVSETYVQRATTCTGVGWPALWPAALDKALDFQDFSLSFLAEFLDANAKE